MSSSISKDSTPSLVNTEEDVSEELSFPTYYFLHVPKTAGTSFLRFLMSYFPPESMYSVARGITKRIAELRDDGTEVSDVGGILEYEKDRLISKRLFSFHGSFKNAQQLPGEPKILFMMRDPEKRLLSAYHYRKRNPDSPQFEALNGPKGISFGEFLFTPSAISNIFVRSLTDGLEDLELALDRAHKLHFIGFQEKFEDSINLLCQIEGWPIPPEVPVLRAANYVNELERLTASQREKLNELTCLDKKLYAELMSCFDKQLVELRDSNRPISPTQVSTGLEVFKAGDRLTWKSRAYWHGWYGIREGLRWSGPSRLAAVDVAIDETVSGICLYFDRVVSAGVHSTMQVTINDVPVNLHWGKVGPEQASIASFSLPESMRSQHFLRIAMNVAMTDDHRCIYPDARLSRQIGVALKFIDFFGDDGRGISEILARYEQFRLKETVKHKDRLVAEQINARDQILYRDSLIKKLEEQVAKIKNK